MVKFKTIYNSTLSIYNSIVFRFTFSFYHFVSSVSYNLIRNVDSDFIVFITYRLQEDHITHDVVINKLLRSLVQCYPVYFAYCFPLVHLVTVVLWTTERKRDNMNMSVQSPKYEPVGGSHSPSFNT